MRIKLSLAMAIGALALVATQAHRLGLPLIGQ
jgi:hypothetical protein